MRRDNTKLNRPIAYQTAFLVPEYGAHRQNYAGRLCWRAIQARKWHLRSLRPSHLHGVSIEANGQLTMLLALPALGREPGTHQLLASMRLKWLGCDLSPAGASAKHLPLIPRAKSKTRGDDCLGVLHEIRTNSRNRTWQSHSNQCHAARQRQPASSQFDTAQTNPTACSPAARGIT